MRHSSQRVALVYCFTNAWMEPRAQSLSQPASQIHLSATSSQCPWPGPKDPPSCHHSTTWSSWWAKLPALSRLSWWPRPPCTCARITTRIPRPPATTRSTWSSILPSLSTCPCLTTLTTKMRLLLAKKNFAKYFIHQSHEEREHAEKLMKLQDQWGGQISLQDIKKPDCDDWGNGLSAMECALHLEKVWISHYWIYTNRPLKLMTLISVISLRLTTCVNR